MGLRYILWFAVILGDIAIIVASAYVTWSEGLVGLALAALAFWVFNGTGGFDAWNPRKVKLWMQNAKRMGL